MLAPLSRCSLMLLRLADDSSCLLLTHALLAPAAAFLLLTALVRPRCCVSSAFLLVFLLYNFCHLAAFPQILHEDMRAAVTWVVTCRPRFARHFVLVVPPKVPKAPPKGPKAQSNALKIPSKEPILSPKLPKATRTEYRQMVRELRSCTTLFTVVTPPSHLCILSLALFFTDVLSLFSSYSKSLSSLTGLSLCLHD
jgi:hypothetical protein